MSSVFKMAVEGVKALVEEHQQIAWFSLRELASRLRSQTALTNGLFLHSVSECLARLMVVEVAPDEELAATQRDLAYGQDERSGGARTGLFRGTSLVTFRLSNRGNLQYNVTRGTR